MTQNNSEIAAFVEKLAEVGSHYRMDEMEELYSEDLAFLVLTPDGETTPSSLHRGERQERQFQRRRE
ncbi:MULTISPECIES: hypothetical protein [Brucella/Ochrobactrum group]|uniref:SnoaL-like domain-containing protein n=1 Tax=Ochrobactrum teleogrylli TaxID=2479765 RepID=A0ABD5K6N5_9HYPH|nr:MULTISPECIES: hypothetical protein [Brucella/Ochrobactrum group]MBA8845860.1 hypothetical protein [Ochrobactrum sp. RH1CCR137]MBA8857581.1 hypothetical protein [Ochrobactrum sp. RH1CCR134]UXO86191.1 hypothetical protein N8I72_22475 [Brucella intermedia]